VIRQGDPGDKFYLIRSGSARVSIRDGLTSRVVATLEAGDFFGETALLRGEPRNATVDAAEDIELYVLGKDDFQHVMATSASFKEQLLKVIFERQ
jgi:CRP-like cAMP-binding protein